jgi:hypothetical protein
VRLFRKNQDLHQLVEYQRRRRALGTVVATPVDALMSVTDELGVGDDDTIAPVISLAAARARRIGHPSVGAGTDAPLSAPR